MFSKNNAIWRVNVAFFGISCAILALFATLFVLSLSGLVVFSATKMGLGVVVATIFLIINGSDAYKAGGQKC